ncbi:MAG: 5-oxoprolinase subunit PxpA [Acidobacteriota bacterium]
MIATVDLNCDMGEGYASDTELMEFVSSVNIACGAHAGDRDTMQLTVDNALRANVAIGAHPGFADRMSFGRKRIEQSEGEISASVTSQINELQQVCISSGAQLKHVKPHGALYNLAATDIATARAIVQAVRAVDPQLMLFGLAGSELLRQAEAIELRGISEVFADRTYQNDGTLTPRTESNALVTNVDESAERALRMVLQGKIMSADGFEVAVRADTICIHGDGEHALVFAKTIRRTLNESQIEVRSPIGTV